MHKNRNEIIRWANAPKDTKVWHKYDGWTRYANPSWGLRGEFVVDDDWAEVRKAKIDGKKIEGLFVTGWEEVHERCTFTMEASSYRVAKATYKIYKFVVQDGNSHPFVTIKFFVDKLSVLNYYDRKSLKILQRIDTLFVEVEEK